MIEKKLSKIVDETKKIVDIALGTDSAYYHSIGFFEMDVEKCEWNGNWYVAGYVPEKPAPTHEEQIAEWKKQLKEIDEKSARSMRAIIAGVATDEDKEFLANLETQAEQIREQLKVE